MSLPSSPHLSEDEQERPLGFPGARLKYTQTIMGGRSGGLGMRLNGKRASTSKRMSGTPRQPEVKNFFSENSPVDEALSTSAPVTTDVSKPASVPSEKWVEVDEEKKVQAPEESTEPKVEIQQATAPEEVPVAKVVQFIPKFKGAAEMEARRRLRMAARRGPGGALPQAQPQPNFDSSSSEDEVEIHVASEMSDDEYDDVVSAGVDSMDEEDEFDP